MMLEEKDLVLSGEEIRELVLTDEVHPSRVAAGEAAAHAASRKTGWAMVRKLEAIAKQVGTALGGASILWVASLLEGDLLAAGLERPGA